MLVVRRHSALVALLAAGLLWGLTVPLSKLVLEWLDGGWLTVVRFALAAPVLALPGPRPPPRPPPRAPRPLPGGGGGAGGLVVGAVVSPTRGGGWAPGAPPHAALIVGAVPA